MNTLPHLSVFSVALVSIIGCSTPPAPPLICTPDAVTSCQGAQDCAGTKQCNSDGSAYGDCVCPNDKTDMSVEDQNNTQPTDMTPDADMRDMSPKDIAPDTSTSIDLTLTAMPQEVPSGSFTRLSWSVYNATACEASDGWGGTQASRDGTSFAVISNLFVDTTFVLTCTNATDSVTKSVTVTIAK